jgi:uncharacterized membrane protein YeaQ/YmgE (transglycosylase-associated protein family)
MLTFTGAVIGAVLGLVCRWFSPAPGIRRDALIAAAAGASGSLGFVWISYFLDWCCGTRKAWHALAAAVTGAVIAMLIRYIEINRRF